MVSLSNPWDIREEHFPHTGSRWEQLRFALQYALLAPSAHNTQPWRFRILPGGSGVELWADRTRGLRIADPNDRELLISCGAALFHVRLALEYFGPQTHVDLWPADNPDLIARVTWLDWNQPHDTNRTLFKNIVWRHTDRSPFQKWALPGRLIDSLQGQAIREGAWLAFIEQGCTRERIADLIAEADLRHGADQAYRRELAHWVRPNWRESNDGLPAWAIGMENWVSSALGPTLIRGMDWGKHKSRQSRKMALAAPGIAVLGTETDTPADWIRAGQALARVLLCACADGVRSSYFNQAVQDPELRADVVRLTGARGAPQMILRLGYGFCSRETPRRPLDQVLS